MRGLVRKSLFQIWSKIVLMIFSILVSACMFTGNYHFMLGLISSYFVCVCSIVDIIEDKKTRWSNYVNCLPVSRTAIVAHRYLSTLTFSLSFIIIQIVFRIIGLIINDKSVTLLAVAELIPACIVACGLVGTVIFVSFLFGYQATYVVYLFFCGAAGGYVGFFSPDDHFALSALPNIDGITSCTAAFFGLILFFVTFAASIYCYKKRDL
ncbi:MAG: ABC-2 transporter permease [Lachnospiraceae bacterium]|nr:ABC-2 transporter permease [Lachnospiraceae bacterium]